MTRHDGAGGDKSPQPSLGIGDRAGEGLCRGRVAVAWNQQHPPRPHLSSVPAVTCPHRGDAAPPGVVTAQHRGHRAGTGSGEKRDNPRQTPLPGPCYGQEKQAGEGRAAQHPLFPLQITTGIFVKEKDLSKLEKDITNIFKKPQLGQHLPVQSPPTLPSFPSGKARLCSQSCPCHQAFGDKGTVTGSWGAQSKQSTSHGRLLSSHLQ